MFNFSAVFVLATITVATIGEGLSSSEPGANIRAGYRIFTTITGPEACKSTPTPVSLRSKPITLTVGDKLHLTDLVVDAYDASGNFLPSTPLEILETDEGNRVLKRDLESARYVWIAAEPGTIILLARDYCVGAGGAETELPVQVVQFSR